MQWDTLAFLPHPTDITDIAPPPDHSPLFASIRWPGQAGLTSAGSVAAGSDGCLLGRIHFPCGYVVYVLLCCWGVFPVLTLYSPRSIVWGLFFSPPFPHVNAVFFFNSTCISLLIILVWLCMWRIIKNLDLDLEPNKHNIKCNLSHTTDISQLFLTLNLLMFRLEALTTFEMTQNMNQLNEWSVLALQAHVSL